MVHGLSPEVRLCSKKNWREPSALKLWNPGFSVYTFYEKKNRISKFLEDKSKVPGANGCCKSNGFYLLWSAVFYHRVCDLGLWCSPCFNFIFQGFGLSYSGEGSQQSIFNDFSSHQLRDPSNFGTFSQSCVTFASWLCQDGHCLFALATTSGIILLIKLPPPGSGGKRNF